MKSKLTIFLMLAFVIGCKTKQVDVPASAIETCKYKNGSHHAFVHYYNPKTRRNSDYKLNVRVKDCKVEKIYFTNGGWLDDSHFEPQQIDTNGIAIIRDDRNRIYSVQIKF